MQNWCISVYIDFQLFGAWKTEKMNTLADSENTDHRDETCFLGINIC